MKKFSRLLLLIFILNSSLYGQELEKNYELEINQQVWKPFKQSYQTYNAEVFNNLHTDDVLRINGRGITLGPDYKASIITGFQRENPPKISIDFSHEHRFYNGDVGYEVGYYRVIYPTPNGDAESYGRFHVVLKKIDGVWKITQDYDTEAVGTTKIDKSFFDDGTFLNLD
jgi:ketosteroid isomerase-like protein